MQDCHFWTEEKLEPLEKAKLVLSEDKHLETVWHGQDDCLSHASAWGKINVRHKNIIQFI